MNKKTRRTRRSTRQAVGFWDRMEPLPAVISVRHSLSRFARSKAFLQRLLGLGP